MTARFIVGDVFDVMAKMPDASVDLVLTSPPFLALRSYLPVDHPDKAKEIGSEPSPAAFIDTLLALTAEWRRLLTPTGSICVELGDTYSGSGGAGGDYNKDGLRDGQQKFSGSAAKRAKAGVGDDYRPSRSGRDTGWPLAKSLCGIPHLYYLSLAYGRNLLTGEPSPAGQWRVRNLVAWCRPNPPVGVLGDKFRAATSYLTVACVSGKRWFDLDAVRTQWARDYDREDATKLGDREFNRNGTVDSDRTIMANPGGAPPLDWWEIPTQAFSGSHYATWPTALLERPIKAMCPQRVCVTCGEPSRRIVGEATYQRTDSDRVPARLAKSNGDRIAEGVNQHHQIDGANTSVIRNAPTLGWSDCGHDNWRNGIVLDPFAGSGTTLVVASGHGRDCIGIDLDARNAELARQRVGMFLEVEHPEVVA